MWSKGTRMEKYIISFRKELLTLSHAAGYEHPAQFTGKDVDICTGVNEFTALEPSFAIKKQPISLAKIR